MNLGIFSLIPFIVAIVLAFWTQAVIPSLFVGVMVGVLFMTGGNIIAAFTTAINDVFVVQLANPANASVIVLLVLIGGFIALIERSGGAEAFAKKVASVLNTRVKVQLASWISGIVIFFSDLGTPLIVGPVFAPIYDKFRISREKLAYIIDVTSASVCVLVPVIGWGAYIMGLISNQTESLNIPLSEWDILLKSIPYNIYAIVTVIAIPIIAFSGYELPRMGRAEERTLAGEKFWENSEPLRLPDDKKLSSKESNVILIWLPIVVLLVTMSGILIPKGFPFKQIAGPDFRAALSTGYLFAAFTIVILMRIYKTHTLKEAFGIYTKGMSGMMSVSVILILSFSLAQISNELGTSTFIISKIVDIVPFWSIAALGFIFSLILTAATGSAWGSWAILFPVIIPLAYTLNFPIHIAVGASLAGGTFGLHPHPLAQQTILAAMGAGTDHMDHVKAQLQYAVINGIVSLIALIIAGITLNPILPLLVGIILSNVIIIVISKMKGTRIKNYTIEEIEEIEEMETIEQASL